MTLGYEFILYFFGTEQDTLFSLLSVCLLEMLEYVKYSLE